MGLKYLKNKSTWSEITREERFFCAHLYFLIKDPEGLLKFINHLNNNHYMSLPMNANWEVAYEACFYRDLWHHRGKKGELFSKKRTFDLCLLSNDTIIIIEAKSSQEFKTDQLESFKLDETHLKHETKVRTVHLAELASSQYTMPPQIRQVYNGHCLTWLELAALYDNDEILCRADAVYEPGSKRSYGRNNKGGYRTGEELMESYENGDSFFVGRSGGIEGKLLSEDFSTGTWRQHPYEINTEVSTAPNENWFELKEFIKRAGPILQPE